MTVVEIIWWQLQKFIAVVQKVSPRVLDRE